MTTPLHECTNDTSPGSESCGGIERRLSRVSRLRDMFQTGTVRPIEEVESPTVLLESEKIWSDDYLRFLRTCPGSPHILSIRSRESTNSPASPSSVNAKTISNGACRPRTIASNLPAKLGPSAVPPVRPPKPRNLLINFDLSAKQTDSTPVHRGKTRVSAQLKKSIALFENGKLPEPSKHTKTSPKVIVGSTPSSECISKVAVEVSNQSSSAVADSVPKTSDQCRAEGTHVKHSNSDVSSKKADVSGDSQTSLAVDQVSADISDGEHSDRDLTGTSLRFDALKRVQSWREESCTGVTKSLDSQGSIPKNFVLRSDAFRVSPKPRTEADALVDQLPALQHAEPVAVASPDEDEDEDDQTVDNLVSTVPSLPVPTGLKVVGVDSQGLHILEDGNFYYATTGISSRPESPDELGLLGKSALSEACSLQTPKTNHDSQSALTDTSCDSFSKHVRFSTEPILIYSTHSILEYDRRNDDIDPIAASAEYELEKNLEQMEIIPVEMKKNAQGLGISFLGSGVDDSDEDQKLGIFIKALTPGGAAEACGLIQVYDQIVEVNGISLVGVSPQFASQTLRGTSDVVHFVLGREKDPANSRIARLIAEQEEPNASDHSATANNSSFNGIARTADSTVDRTDGTGPSEEPSHETLSDIQSTVLANSNWRNEDEVIFDESTEISFSSDPLLALKCTGENGTTGTGDSTVVRSALKGTATAASTRRRHDAVTHLIRSARGHSLAAFNSTVPTNGDMDSSEPETVQWVLASALLDSQHQLVKMQSRLQSLEQRLTAQEAAADEAIERLCLQCRHVELELQETRERFRQYIKQQCLSDEPISHAKVDQSSPFLTSSPLRSIVTNQVNGVSPEPAINRLSAASQASAIMSTVDPNGNSSPASVQSFPFRIWSSNLLGYDPASARALLLQQVNRELDWPGVLRDPTTHVVPDELTDPLDSSSDLDSGSGHSEHCVHFPGSPTCHLYSTKSVDPQSNISRDKVRLVSSGAMSTRRPRTRLELNPPPFRLPELFIPLPKAAKQSDLSIVAASAVANGLSSECLADGLITDHSPKIPLPRSNSVDSLHRNSLVGDANESPQLDQKLSDGPNKVLLPGLGTSQPAVLRRRTDESSHNTSSVDQPSTDRKVSFV